jgi:dTDP-4-dehydrorhamnose reductase
MVTGAKGMLGGDLCAVLAPEHEVMGRDIDDFNVEDGRATKAAILEARPGVIVHLAAFTDVDGSEDQRGQAFRSNALGTMNVAIAARDSGAHLVYLSTDYVFDGAARQPYLEIDEPHPVNFYGLTKLYGEKYVTGLTTRHLIIRTSWLFGPGGRNFVDTMLSRASKGEKLQVVADQKGSPTYTLDLARGIKAAIEMGLEGLLHLTNSGDTTWFELAKHALTAAGLGAEIEPVTSECYPTRARRPRYSVLGSLVATHGGIAALPAWQDAVADYIKRRGAARK